MSTGKLLPTFQSNVVSESSAPKTAEGLLLLLWFLPFALVEHAPCNWWPHVYQNQIQTVLCLVVSHHGLRWSIGCNVLFSHHLVYNQFCQNLWIQATNTSCRLTPLAVSWWTNGKSPPAEIKVTSSCQLFLNSRIQYRLTGRDPGELQMVSQESLEINYVLARYSVVTDVSKPSVLCRHVQIISPVKLAPTAKTEQQE